MRTSVRDATRNLAQARRLLRSMVRDGRLEQSEADDQLGTIERAARAGVPVLVVADIRSPKPHRAAVDNQRRRTARG
jgi:hypothetical protein